MKVKKYEYLVAYHYAGGMGTAFSIRTKKIESKDDAIDLAKELEKTGGVENVGLINIQLLREFTE